jgi:hypothetical protein
VQNRKQDIEDIFAICHDGCIEKAIVTGDEVKLEIGLLYITELIDPNHRFLNLTLKKVKSVEFDAWTDEKTIITSWDEIVSFRIELLSTETDESGRIVIHSRCDHAPDIKFSGGKLIIDCEDYELFDEAGNPLSVEKLEEYSSYYWNVKFGSVKNNASLIEAFYQSFAKGDAEGMVSCYDDAIIFSDPAFGELKGDNAKNMWRMLIANSKGNTKISFDHVQADDKTGSANWVAEYIFSQTGRKVINKISASFEFANGKIVRHTDRFNLWKWSRQALGWKGWLLGWTPLMKNKIQKQTNKLLSAYKSKR